MDMIFIEILQLNWYAVPELPPSRNTLHNCMIILTYCSTILNIIALHIFCKENALADAQDGKHVLNY